MSFPIASLATRAPDLRDRDHTDHSDHTDGGHRPEPSRVWALIEVLAYAGAFIDPSGILAVQRLRQAEEEEEKRRGRR